MPISQVVSRAANAMTAGVRGVALRAAGLVHRKAIAGRGGMRETAAADLADGAESRVDRVRPVASATTADIAMSVLPSRKRRGCLW